MRCVRAVKLGHINLWNYLHERVSVLARGVRAAPKSEESG